METSHSISFANQIVFLQQANLVSCETILLQLKFGLSLSIGSKTNDEKMANCIDSNLEMETQNILLNHIVWPRLLPQEKERFVHEQALVLQLVENVESLAEWLPEKTVEMMDRLRRVTRENTRTVICDIINELEPGDSFSMFVRRQNCAIMFYLPATEVNNIENPLNVIVGTFQAALHPRKILNHENEIEVRVANFNECFLFLSSSK